jgi:isoleucyl-tRNA synthetase
VASGKGITVAVDVAVTPALRAEGLVRDIVRHVQTLRKEADYQLDARITVGLFGLDEELSEAVHSHEGYLRQETLCDTLLTAPGEGAWDARERIALGGRQIEVAVRR